MVHPEIDFPPTGGAQNFSGTLTGVYASTEKLKNGGITGRVMNKMMDTAIGMGIQDIQETLPDYILREKGLCPLNFAIRNKGSLPSEVGRTFLASALAPEAEIYSQPQ